MDRLTYYEAGRACFKIGDTEYFGEVPDRLAAYEDTGLEPKQAKIIYGLLAEVAEDRNCHFDFVTQCVLHAGKAEKEGRLILLPCKVTDTVYTIESIYNGRKYAGEKVVSAQIDHVTIGGTTGQPVFDLCTETGGWFYSMEPGQFFLTREEAEKVMEEWRKIREAD